MRSAAQEIVRGRDELSDGELVDLAKQGDETAVRALIQRYNRQLYRVARGVVRDDAEAEDIVQETYVRAFTRLHSFRGEASLSTWLTRIVINEALGRLRRRRPSAPDSVLDHLNDSDGGQVMAFNLHTTPASPEGEAGREQVRRVLEQAVDELPEPFRMVFMLRDIEGLSTEETADHLAIRTETAKTRLHRARKLMRIAIEKRLAASFGELFPFGGQRCAGMAERVLMRLRES